MRVFDQSHTESDRDVEVIQSHKGKLQILLCESELQCSFRLATLSLGKYKIVV